MWGITTKNSKKRHSLLTKVVLNHCGDGDERCTLQRAEHDRLKQAKGHNGSSEQE